MKRKQKKTDRRKNKKLVFPNNLTISKQIKENY